jgi:O-antigen ligase
VTTWITFVALTQILGAVWLDGVMDRIVSRPRAIRRTAVALGAGVTIASLVAIYQGAIDFSFLSTANWTSLHRATGTLMDANAYGVVAAIGGVLAFLGFYLRRRRSATTAGLAMLAVSFAGMWMSASRTALLCAIGGAAGLIAAAVLRRGLNLKRTAPLAAVLAIVAVVALGSGSLGVGPLRRLNEMPWGYTSELASLVRRGGYGTVALQMVHDYPLTGVGVGSFNFMASDYWRSPAYSLPFDNAQNWWRHEAAEMGLLGGLAIVGWSLLAGWVLLTRRLAPEGRFTAVALRGALLGIAACSMLGMPTQNPLVLLIFFLAVGWLATLVLDPDLPVVSRHQTAAWTVVTLIAIGYAGGHLWLARHSLSVAARAVRWHREYVVGAYPSEPMTEGAGGFRWTRSRATFIWPTRPGVLLVHIWASNPDIVQHPVNISLSMPCGVLMNETLRSGYPLELAFEVPKGQEAVEASIRVSRTWRPADMLADNGDRRALGVAVWQDWGPPEEAGHTPITALPPCRDIP